MRLPASLPSTVVRRVVCDSCAQGFEADEAADIGTRGEAPVAGTAGRSGAAAAAGTAAALAASARDRAAGLWEAAGDRLAPVLEGLRDRLPVPPARLERLRPDRNWAWITAPLAAIGVMIGLSILQDDSSVGSATASAPAADEVAAREARFVSRPGFSLALPAGWEQTNPPQGATFHAESKDGMADATLWIEEDPDLGFRQFERRSLTQLGELSPNARVVDRVAGPSIESMITELRAEPTTNGVAAPYRVTLRGAGPYRLYFATAEQPGAKPYLGGDIELMHGSFRPNVTVEGLG